MIEKISLAAKSIVIGLAVVATALFALAIVVWKLNSVDRISTSMAYEFYLKKGVYENLFEAISADAMRSGLKRKSQNGTQKQEATWISEREYGVHIFAPISSAGDADIVEVHVSIFDASGKNSSLWEAQVKRVEGVLSPYLSDARVTLQLDPQTYGTCPSTGEEQKLPSVCFFPLTLPVDFEQINSKILIPRSNNLINGRLGG